MKNANEPNLFTELAEARVYEKNNWVYLEKTVTIPANIKQINLRAGFYHHGTNTNVWFDNLRIVEVSNGNEIIEESNYYPFDLKHKGYNNVVSSNGNSVAQRRKFGGKEFNDELGLNWYDVSARNYDPALGRWMNVDPLAEQFPSWSPYNFTMNNPIRFIDPDGRAPQDIIDIAKNDKGEWEITNVQITEGDDIFRVTNEGETTNYTFSEGEYGKRFNVLNLENNDNYTLGVYHISGQEGEGASGFTVTPGGSASTEVNSGKRLPDDTYSLSATGNGSDQPAFKWVQPLLNTGEEGGYVGGRGVKIHPVPSKLTQTKASQWTAGCYVVCKDYSLQNGNVFYNSKQSIKTSNQINTILGGTNTIIR